MEPGMEKNGEGGRGGGLLLEFTGDNVTKDFEFAAGVHAESCAGLDAILVYHTQGAVVLMGIVFVSGLI
jgi:hypothetical protein